MFRLLEDDSFEFEVDGKRTKGLIRAVATADDIIKAASLGCSAVAAEVFLPEAVEEAKKRGVELVNVESLIESIAEFLVNALANREMVLPAKFFDYLDLPWKRCRYMHWEIPKGTIWSIHFKAEFSVPKDIKLVEGTNVLIMRIISKLFEKGIKASLKTKVDNRGVLSMELELRYTIYKSMNVVESSQILPREFGRRR